MIDRTRLSQAAVVISVLSILLGLTLVLVVLVKYVVPSMNLQNARCTITSISVTSHAYTCHAERYIKPRRLPRVHGNRTVKSSPTSTFVTSLTSSEKCHVTCLSVVASVTFTDPPDSRKLVGYLAFPRGRTLQPMHELLFPGEMPNKVCTSKGV